MFILKYLERSAEFLMGLCWRILHSLCFFFFFRILATAPTLGMLTRKGLRIEGNKYPQLEVLASYVSIHVWTLFCTFVCLSVCILVCVCLQLTYISLQLNHSVQPLSHRHTHKQQTSQATGKQHYLQANPSYGVRQLQTLHVTPPCHLHHTHVYAHTQRHTPQVSNHPAHFLTISSLSFPLPPSLHVILCHSPCAKLH